MRRRKRQKQRSVPFTISTATKNNITGKCENTQKRFILSVCFRQYAEFGSENEKNLKKLNFPIAFSLKICYNIQRVYQMRKFSCTMDTVLRRDELIYTGGI